jgi:hypothetical protein
VAIGLSFNFANIIALPLLAFFANIMGLIGGGVTPCVEGDGLLAVTFVAAQNVWRVEEYLISGSPDNPDADELFEPDESGSLGNPGVVGHCKEVSSDEENNSAVSRAVHEVISEWHCDDSGNTVFPPGQTHNNHPSHFGRAGADAAGRTSHADANNPDPGSPTKRQDRGQGQDLRQGRDEPQGRNDRRP